MSAPDWAGYLRFRDTFARGMDQRLHPVEWLDWALMAGFVAGFFGRESALIAQATDYPGGARVGTVMHALGSMDELVNEIRPRAEAWARDQGCTEIVIEGTRGWTRLLGGHGYRPLFTAVTKEL